MTGTRGLLSLFGRRFGRRTLLSAGAGLMAAAAAPAEAKGDDPLAVALGIISDWRRRDLEAVLARVADDIVWYYHVGAHPPLVGKAAMRAFLVAMLDRVSDNRWRVFNHAVSGENVFLEGVDDFKAADGARIEAVYMGILRVRAGKVVEWRDYFDGGMVDRMKRGERPDGVEALVTRPAIP